MATFKLKSVASWTNRHGTPVHYFRKRGSAKIRIRGNPGDATFMADYHACLSGAPLPERSKPQLRQIRPVTDSKSLGWLCQQYIHHHTFKDLDDKTRKPRISILNQLCAMPLAEGSLKKLGDLPFEEMPSKVIRRIRDSKADTPSAANNWLKAIKALFAWAIEEEHASHNPARDVPKLKEGGDGFHTWTLEELTKWEAFYPIGTKARLACALLLYTGCRRTDVVSYAPQDVKDGFLTYTQNKNRNRKPVTLTLPILKPLANIIAASEVGPSTFLVSDHGEPFTIEGLDAGFANGRGLPGCRNVPRMGCARQAPCAVPKAAQLLIR